MIVEGFNANQVKPSNQVGLHPQLVAYDVVSSDGANVGFNVVGNPESDTPDGRQTALRVSPSSTSGTRATSA